MDRNSPQTVQEAFQLLFSSVEVIYYEFEGYFFLSFAIVIAYVFFYVGKISISQPIAKKAFKVSSIINKAQSDKIRIPKQIQSIKSRKKFTVFVTLLLIISVIILQVSKKMKLSPVFIGGGISILILYWIVLTIQQNVLNNRNKLMAEKDKQILESVKDLSQSLGPKVQQSLKTSLCRQKILSKKSTPSNQCSKKQCKEHRLLLKNRYQAIKHLTQSAINFQWCSICKRRQPFDELVKFEAKIFPQIPTDDQNTQVTLRIKFMNELLQELDKWINQAGPCNCSKLFIDQIVNNKRIYSQISKPMQQKIKQIQLQQKRKNQRNIQRKSSQNASSESIKQNTRK